MEGIINSVRNLFGTYGFHAAAVVLATIAVVNVVKRPLVKKAEELAARTGIDKSVVTKNVTIIPVAVAFVIELVVAVIAARFDFRAVDYGRVVTTSVLYGALAIATYESVKKQLRAYAASLNGRFGADDGEQAAPEKSQDDGEKSQPDSDQSDCGGEQPIGGAADETCEPNDVSADEAKDTADESAGAEKSEPPVFSANGD